MARTLVIKNADFYDHALEQVIYDGVHAESVTISQSTASLDSIGATLQLGYTVVPSDAEDSVTWTSSNNAVASVSRNGLVTVNGCGTCTITVKVGKVTDTCAVTVAVLLDGYGKYPKAYSTATNATGYLTYVDTLLTTSNHNYDIMMLMCKGKTDYNNELLLTYRLSKYNETAQEQRVMEPSEMGASTQRIYNQIGYPMPIMLPSNCTKIKCTGLDAHYGVIPFFFQSDVHAYGDPTLNTDVGKGYYQAKRQLSDYTGTWVNDSVNWTYQKDTEINIPSGYDSIALLWRADTDNGGIAFADMTASQLAEFIVLCL